MIATKQQFYLLLNGAIEFKLKHEIQSWKEAEYFYTTYTHTCHTDILVQMGG